MLKFIGTGSAFNTELENNSAYIKYNENLLLIDCGETTFSRIIKLDLLKDVKNVYIILTHTHSDHIGSVATLIEYLNIAKGIVPNIVLSNNEKSETEEKVITEYLSIQGIQEDDFDFTYADMLEDILPDLKKIELVEVKHTKNIPSKSVELYFKNFTIYYVSDNNDKTYLKSVSKKLKENDLVYTDCTNKDYPNRAHVLLSELAEIFGEEKRKQITTMHFDSYNCIEQSKGYGFKTAEREKSKQEILNNIIKR